MNETATGFFARLKQRKLVQWAIGDVAFAWLDRAVQAKDPGAMSLTEAAPEVVANLRKDRRFAAFCKKVGLPSLGEVDARKAATASQPAVVGQ